MCGEQDDLLVAHLSKELEHRALALGVQTGDRLIQDHHRGILVDQARQGQALPLSAGQIELASKACADEGVDPVR